MIRSGIKVFAPASVSNMAVGFGILGFALEKPGDEVLVKDGIYKGLKITHITGASSKLSFEIEKNTAGFAAQRLLEHIGETNRPLEMEIHKKMPIGAGLGSSAASAVAGVFAINEFLKTGLTKRELLAFAVQAEQMINGKHNAVNVAPSMLGGMILVRDNDSLDLKKLYLPSGLYVAILCPHIQVLAKNLQAILSQQLDFEKVIKQQGNLAAFVSAMYTSDIPLLSRSLQDLLIEPQRAHLIPHFYAMKELSIAEGALGFSISGAGPSMFAFCDNSLKAEQIVEKAKKLYTDNKIDLTCYLSKINQEGVILF